MTAIVEHMDAGAAAVPQPTAPVVLDDASLDRLADLLRARILPTRPPWQTSLLVTLAGALIAAATAGYFSLRGDITTLGASLRTEIAAVEESLRTEIAAVEESLRTEIAAGDAGLRAELQDFRDEFNMVARDHTDRLARLETVQAHHTELLTQHSEQLAHHTELLTQHSAQLAHHTELLTQHSAQLAHHTEQLTRLEAAHPHPASP